MIPRYSRNLMAKVWEPDNRFRTWLKIEIFACEAMARLGQVPPEAVKIIRKKAGFEVERIDAIEKVVKHDVIAFLTAVGERVGPEARYLHLGMTSSDVLDTSLAMLLVEAAEVLEQDLLALLEVLKKRAYEHKTTPIIGRTGTLTPPGRCAMSSAMGTRRHSVPENRSARTPKPSLTAITP